MSESAYWNQMYANALEGQRPFILLRPRISIDGNQWCALYGENLQDGVAGFGDSPELAAWDFDKAWCEKIKAKSDEKITPNSEIKLHPAVMEAIDSHAKYYAERHKIGLSVRNDMIYVAEVAVRWADAKGASDTVAVPRTVKQCLDAVIEELNLDTTDPFTRALAAAFAMHDSLKETKAALIRCQDEVHLLRAAQEAK